MAIKPYGIPKDDAFVAQKGPISATKLPANTGPQTQPIYPAAKEQNPTRPDPLPKPEVFERTIVKKPGMDLSKPQVQPRPMMPPRGMPTPIAKPRPTSMPQTQPKPTGIPVRQPGLGQEVVKPAPAPGFNPTAPRKPDEPRVDQPGPIRAHNGPQVAQRQVANTPGRAEVRPPANSQRARNQNKLRKQFGAYGSQVTPGAFNMRDNLNRRGQR